jgi:cytosine/adenosine deaminase-related metal-dependent hydrolase
MPHPEATRLFRARTVVPVIRSPIEDGGVAVRDGKILAIGMWNDLIREYSAAIIEDLGECILLPGFINAHCHLDYTMMRGALAGEKSFSAWIQRLNAIRRSLDQADYLAAISAGIDELRMWGCTTVLNIESFPEIIPLLPTPAIRVINFLEVMDIRSRLNSEEALAGAINFSGQAPRGSGGVGISPHAPYTASRQLYDLVRIFAGKYALPICTHLAESDEEISMFTRGDGPLHDFLRSIGRPMEDCRGVTPVQALLSDGLLPEGSLLVHMNFLDGEDRSLLRRLAGSYPVIHCPRTHAFFSRPRFDLGFFRDAGIPVLLGTDSLASNQDLNMFAELRAMRDSFPDLDPAEILAMATIRPAAAIGHAGLLGELSPGAVADFLAIPDEGGDGSPAERVLANRVPPRIWISGRS